MDLTRGARARAAAAAAAAHAPLVARRSARLRHRAVTIVAAALLFHTHVSASSALGVVLIIGGSIGYAAAKAGAPAGKIVVSAEALEACDSNSEENLCQGAAERLNAEEDQLQKVRNGM